ncbi:MAG: hypothetical protein ACJ8H8_20490, partial [Geminicoccaceae bacterium]
MVLIPIFACLRRLSALDRARRTRLPRPAEGGSAFAELLGRTVGLVGYGPVPARLYWHDQREP